MSGTTSASCQEVLQESERALTSGPPVTGRTLKFISLSLLIGRELTALGGKCPAEHACENADSGKSRENSEAHASGFIVNWFSKASENCFVRTVALNEVLIEWSPRENEFQSAPWEPLERKKCKRKAD
jgi:hypothetical protein